MKNKLIFALLIFSACLADHKLYRFTWFIKNESSHSFNFLFYKNGKIDSTCAIFPPEWGKSLCDSSFLSKTNTQIYSALAENHTNLSTDLYLVYDSLLVQFNDHSSITYLKTKDDSSELKNPFFENGWIQSKNGKEYVHTFKITEQNYLDAQK